MEELEPEEVETAAARSQPVSRRARLRAMLRTPEGRTQAVLLADILSPPVAKRRRGRTASTGRRRAFPSHHPDQIVGEKE